MTQNHPAAPDGIPQRRPDVSAEPAPTGCDHVWTTVEGGDYSCPNCGAFRPVDWEA